MSGLSQRRAKPSASSSLAPSRPHKRKCNIARRHRAAVSRSETASGRDRPPLVAARAKRFDEALQAETERLAEILEYDFTGLTVEIDRASRGQDREAVGDHVRPPEESRRGARGSERRSGTAGSGGR